jgi:L-cystine uptake protein TcyP (sodium:dicarboxylate symporter family)
MEKAYDIKDLGEKLKQIGLPMAEVAAEQVLSKVVEWIKESAAISKNPYDDMALIVIPLIEEKIKKAIDKIDNVEG